MILLGLDPGTSTGYALLSIEGNIATIYDYGIINVDISSDYNGDHCIDLMNKVQELIYTHSVDHICVEDYFFSKRFCTGSKVNIEFRSAIYILARQNSIDYTILGVYNWKRYIAGRISPTKEQKKKWGKLAKKLYIQEALWKKYKIKFPSFCKSPKSGKPISLKYDIIDAVAQSIYYCSTKRIYTIKNSVTIPENYFEKRTKILFDYDSV